MFESSSNHDEDVDRRWRQAMVVALDQIAGCREAGPIAILVEELVLDHLGSEARCLYVDEDEAIMWSARDDLLEAEIHVGLAGLAATSNRTVRVDAVARVPRHAPLVDGTSDRLMVVPVGIAGHAVHAVVVVGRRARQPPFNLDDQARLEYFGRLLAPTLARLALAAELSEPEDTPPLEAVGPYRAEALAERMSQRSQGELAHLDSPWIAWSFRGLVGISLLIALYAGVVQVGDHAVGPAVVRLGGRAEVAAIQAGTVAEILVSPGEAVDAGQPLIALHDTDVAAQLASLELQFEQHLRRLLLDPDDEGAKSAITALRGQRLRAGALRQAYEVKASAPGVVLDLRVRTGQPVATGDVLLALGRDPAEASVLALLPGEDRPRMCPGLPLHLSVEGYPDAHVELVVAEVSEDVIAATEALRLLGPAVAAGLDLQGPVALVRAALPDGFASDGTRYRYHDGMHGLAEVEVRSTSLIEALVPGLHWLPLPRSGPQRCAQDGAPTPPDEP